MKEMHTILRRLHALARRDMIATASIAAALVISAALFAMERTDALPLQGQSMPSYGWYMDEWEMARSPIATAPAPRWRSSKVQQRLDRRIRWYHNAASSQATSSSTSSRRARQH